MTSIILVHPEERQSISATRAFAKCGLFQNNVTLAKSPYQLHSSVSLSSFREFVSVLQGNAVTITPQNFPDLQQLSDEFHFSELSTKLSTFRHSHDLTRFASLEEKSHRQARAIAVLEDKFAQLSLDFRRLTEELSTFRSVSTDIQTLRQKLSAELDGLQKEVSILKMRPKTTSLDSRIISGFPAIFAEFQQKEFSLLWRGSSHGFGAAEFHRRCDGHPNTLTVILDTEGNVFGGFTPVKWESRVWNGKKGDASNRWKADDSLRSFLFTLKNPNNVPERRFPLKVEMKNQAIRCDSQWGPSFCDIGVFDKGNSNSFSTAGEFGKVYKNDTGIDGSKVFRRSGFFSVKEVEVFEISE